MKSNWNNTASDNHPLQRQRPNGSRPMNLPKAHAAVRAAAIRSAMSIGSKPPAWAIDEMNRHFAQVEAEMSKADASVGNVTQLARESAVTSKARGKLQRILAGVEAKHGRNLEQAIAALMHEGELSAGRAREALKRAGWISFLG